MAKLRLDIRLIKGGILSGDPKVTLGRPITVLKISGNHDYAAATQLGITLKKLTVQMRGKQNEQTFWGLISNRKDLRNKMQQINAKAKALVFSENRGSRFLKSDRHHFFT